jgi:hypothetical protein
MITNACSTILLKIRKQSALEEAEEHEPKPEIKERVMTVSELTESLRITEAGIKVFEERTASSKQLDKHYGDARLLRRDSEGEEKIFVSTDFSA